MTSPFNNNKFYWVNGTPDRTRTGTLLPAGDFKSPVSTISTTGAYLFFLFPYLVYILYTKNKELSIKNLVSVVGFEPTVSCLKGKCINRLCYTLIFFWKISSRFSFKNPSKILSIFSFSLNLIIYYIIKFRGFQVNC